MLLSYFSTRATQSILTILTSAIVFLSNVTVPGTNISFLKLMSMVLLYSVLVWAFRKMLGVESGYVIRNLHKPINKKSSSSEDGGN